MKPCPAVLSRALSESDGASASLGAGSPRPVGDVRALGRDVADLTIILNRMENPDYALADDLPLIYDELRRYAASRMSQERRDHTLQPTALVHEAWLRISRGGDRKGRKWDNRAHFFGAAAKAMRRILIESVRRKHALKRGGAMVRVDIDQVDLADTSGEEKVLLIDEALSRLESVHPEKAQIVLLKYYGGHSNQKVAEILGISERTVERHWAYSKAWLFQSISGGEG